MRIADLPDVIVVIVALSSTAAVADVKRLASMPEPLWGSWAPSADACKNADNRSSFQRRLTPARKEIAPFSGSAKPPARADRSIPRVCGARTSGHRRDRSPILSSVPTKRTRFRSAPISAASRPTSGAPQGRLLRRDRRASGSGPLWAN